MNERNLDAIKYNNYILNQQEIKDKKIILKSKPLSLKLDITANCQLKCIMCLSENKRDVTLDFKYISKIIKLHGNELISVQWMGGEPTTHPDFEKIISYTNSFGIMQTITTNGLLLKAELAEKLIKFNADITISIDGSTKELYESIRCGANFETLVSNIENLNKLRKKYNHTGHFGINFCIIQQNYDDVFNMVHFAKKYSFQDIYFIKVTNKYRLTGQDDIKFTKVFNIAHSEALKNGINFLGWSPFGIRKHNTNANDLMLSCYTPFFYMVVDYDGNFKSCICNERVIKQIEEVKDLDSLWNCKQMQQYRKNIYDNKLPDEDICGKSCFLIGFRSSYHPQIITKLNNIKNTLEG